MFQPPFFGACYLAARADEVDCVILSGTDQLTAKSPNRDGGWQYTGMVHTLLKDGWWNLPTSGSMLSCDETPLAISEKWVEKAVRRLKHQYGKYLSHSDLRELETLLSREDATLGDFNTALFAWSLQRISIDTEITRDYLWAERGTDKSDTALQLAVSIGATEYVAGEMGIRYLDLEEWADHGIKITKQDWKPPVGLDPASSVLNWLS